MMVPSADRSTKRKAPVVLVVEDDDVARQLLVIAFEDAGMHVEEASSRDDALRRARRRRPDLVVMDRQLPDGDGWQAVGELKKIAGTQQELIVIAMTGQKLLSNAERALVAGCDAFLEKPCDPQAVVENAQRLLGARPPRTTVRPTKLRDT